MNMTEKDKSGQMKTNIKPIMNLGLKTISLKKIKVRINLIYVS